MFIIERDFLKAAAFSGVGAICTFFCLIHSEAMGIGRLPDQAFTHQPFAVDWLDTRESQALLHYQNHTFQDYTQDLRRRLGGLRWLVQAARPLVRQWLLNQSPYARVSPA